MGILKQRGIKGMMYQFFRRKEIELYKLSEHIGCMSPANVEYLLTHNSFIDKNIVCLAPNSYESSKYSVLNENEKNEIRQAYGVPINKTIFLYGGNLGIPQGISFLID